MNITSNVARRVAIAALAVAATTATFSVASAGGDANGGDNPPILTHDQVKHIRTATSRFRDVDAAVAAGFVPTDVCAAVPGLGAMGHHYVNPANIMDGVIEPAKPEILLYHVDDEGDLKLGGVEYFAPDADQDLSTDADRPDLFGHPFDGPMPGHETGMPVHYDLHVWLYTKNPTGLLSAWNPKVDCPPTGTHRQDD